MMCSCKEMKGWEDRMDRRIGIEDLTHDASYSKQSSEDKI